MKQFFFSSSSLCAVKLFFPQQQQGLLFCCFFLFRPIKFEKIQTFLSLFSLSKIIRIKRVYTFKRARERDAQILHTHTHTHVPVYIDFTNPHALEEETEESKERESEY